MKNNSENIGAVILAGGEARRLNGIAKGNLEISRAAGGEKYIKIISFIINELKKSQLKNIVISANRQEYQCHNLPLLADEHKEIGPLAGIESGLRYFAKTVDAVLFLPCDLPKISANEITSLINYYLQSKNKIVFAATAKNKHPLCAIVPTKFLPEVSAAISAGKRRVLALWEELGAAELRFTNNDAFVNINTEQQLTMNIF
jgi:molybdenum cofactor guanylyltransferase